MSEDENQPQKEIDIPEMFKTEEGEHFKNCIICEQNLLETGEPYVIEKAVRKYQQIDTQAVIFEYAMCMTCAEKMRKKMSKESLQKMEEHFASKANLMGQWVMMSSEDYTIDDLTDHCIITGKNLNSEDLEEYQIYAHCKGDKLQVSHMPFMISGQAMEEMSHLLSEKTKEELDGFIDDFFGLPPEWKKALKDRDVVLV